MTTLFFLLLFLPFYNEVAYFFNPNKQREIVEKLKNVKDMPESDERTKLSKKLSDSVFAQLFYLILTIIGSLMASQWILFLVLIIIGFISGGFKQISKNAIYRNTIISVDSIICATILLYIIINHFHHINYVPLDVKGFLHFVGI